MYKLAVQKKIWLLVKFPQMYPSYIAFNLVSVEITALDKPWDFHRLFTGKQAQLLTCRRPKIRFRVQSSLSTFSPNAWNKTKSQQIGNGNPRNLQNSVRNAYLRVCLFFLSPDPLLKKSVEGKIPQNISQNVTKSAGEE